MKIKSFVVVAVLVTAILCSASFVSAQTVDNSALIAQLQTQIQSLMKQIQQLLAQQKGEQAWCHTFNTNLGFTNSGSAEVGALHTILDKQGFSYTPDTGNAYDEGTAAAVIQFQQKYSISPLSGYIGPKTRAKLNSLYKCGITPLITCTPNWTCSGWNTCTNGMQTRECTDSNNCGITINQPTATQTCSSNSTALAKLIQITSPNSGVALTVGQDYNVSYILPQQTTDNILIYLYDNSGHGTLLAQTTNAFGTKITIPVSNPWSNTEAYPLPQTIYKIIIRLQNNNEISGASGYFSIISAVPPIVSTTTPKSNCTPDWLCAMGPCVNGYLFEVPFDMNKCNLPLTQATVVCKTQAKSCPIVTASCTEDSECTKITSVYCTKDMCPLSKCVDKKCVTLTQASVTVTSPNGGETWKIGETHNIIWNTQNGSSYSNVQISLNGMILANTTNSGSYSWTIPSVFLNNIALRGGNIYRIKIFMIDYGTGKMLSDVSDNYFSIVAP